LVLGSGFTALGVLRNLAAAGVVAHLVIDAPDLTKSSRWYRPPPGAEGKKPTPGTLATFLEGLAIDRAVLVPCSDHWTVAAAGLPAALIHRFPRSLPTPSALVTLTDKAAFGDFCARAGIPRPDTWLIDHPEALGDLPEAAFRNAFLKPRDSQAFVARVGVKALHVADRADAIRLATHYAAKGFKLILQRYVAGPASNHYFVDGFVDRQGDDSAVFVRRRLRMYPTDFGNSSYMVSVPPAEATPAVESVRRALAQLDYRGVFSAEFKRDADDGVFRVLEINARPWWYVRFAAQCGMNLCGRAYADALGQSPPPATAYRVGRGCMHVHYDYFACRELLRTGQVSRRSWLWSWLTSHKAAFEWNDPLPACVDVARILGRALRNRLLHADPPSQRS
jgi:predicted ATP-grasp superfamily ATP-dependent carboligase